MPYSAFTSETPLTNDQLQRFAPSIFANRPWQEMSSRYRFIGTADLIEELRGHGFEPFSVRTSLTRIDGKGDFAKHQLRLRKTDIAPIAALGGAVPEAILTNSHDGSSPYLLNLGLFRFVCWNGMVVGDSFGQFKVRHSGKVGDVIDAVYEVVDEFPRAIAAAEEFAGIMLSDSEQLAFAEAALQVRYDGERAPIAPEQALTLHRHEDQKPTLWNTFNVLQENLTQGGLRGRAASGRRLRTRAVNGISENTTLNRALWALTEKMAELKGAQLVAA